MEASHQGHVEVTALLLEAGFARNWASDDGTTALMLTSPRVELQTFLGFGVPILSQGLNLTLFWGFLT